MHKKHPVNVQFATRFRLLRDGDIALGPGKIELLRKVHETGSIANAAREMKMSYMRAWSLIQTMNRCFCAPLITSARGGTRRGGAHLTETGQRVLALADRLDRAMHKAALPSLDALSRLIKRES